jgi:glycosyltransferase involved in cell wall biosynthesis
MARVLFIVRSLEGGGAERQLCVLAAGLSRSGHDVAVAVFYPGGPYADQLLGGTGVELISLDKRGVYETFGFFWRSLRLVRRFRPDVIHGYMDLGNLVAAVMRAAAPRATIAWGLRNAHISLDPGDHLGRLVAEVCRALSWTANVIISNSLESAEYYVARGYPRRRMRVIPNGVDTQTFRPDPAGRTRVRAEWSVGAAERLVGIVGRLHPDKDHDTFLAAATRLSARRPEVRFVCVGHGDEPYRSELLGRMREAGLGERLRHVPFRRDMPAVYSALDLATLTSTTESFSNALAEAMSCGVPCVATDVGDTRLILGALGAVVPPRDPEALSAAWESALSSLSPSWSTACRAHIVDNFGVERLVSRSAEALRLRAPALRHGLAGYRRAAHMGDVTPPQRPSFGMD